MKILNSLKIAGVAATIAAFSPTVSSAATLTAASVGSSFAVDFECDIGEPCPDSGNTPDVKLSALAVFDLVAAGTTSGNSYWDFSVAFSNTTPSVTVGTNRITAMGFAVDPDATIGSATNNASGPSWAVGSDFIPGFNGEVELCVFATNGCASASGGALNGLQEEQSDVFGFRLTSSGLVSSITIDNFAVKFASVGANGGSYEFGGEECVPNSGSFDCPSDTSPVPVPGGLPLMLTALGVGAFLRRKSRNSA